MADNNPSLEYAVSRLMGEAEKPTSVSEPEDVAENEETLEEESSNESEVETEDVEQEVTSEEESPEEGSEEEDETEEEPAEYYVVKVDGEEMEVTLDELRSGYQRQKDYTKKTQALAEERKSYESRMQAFAEEYEQFQATATVANDMLTREIKSFDNIDWATLEKDDPVAYVRKKMQLQEAKEKRDNLIQNAQKAYELNLRKQQEEMRKFVEFQRKEAEKFFPDWKSEEKAHSHQLEIIKYGQSLGYTPEELGQIVKARDLLVLDKAMKYDKLQEAKNKVTQKKAAPAIRKVVKPKGRASKTASREKEIQTQVQRLRETGNLKDAAALLYNRAQARNTK